MIKYLLAMIVGGAAGALLGTKGSCSTGACPLTSNPYIGALYGAGLGYLVLAAFAGSTAGSRYADEKDADGAVASVVTKEEFQNRVLQSEVPVLVDFWATWCGPCRSQMPIVEDLAARVGDKARVFKVNVDRAGVIAEEFRVSSIPTLVVFRNGAEVHRFVGVQSADTLSKALGI